MAETVKQFLEQINRYLKEGRITEDSKEIVTVSGDSVYECECGLPYVYSPKNDTIHEDNDEFETMVNNFGGVLESDKLESCMVFSTPSSDLRMTLSELSEYM